MNSYTCCQASSVRSKDIGSLAIILKILAEENRLKILCVLDQGGHCVCEIIEHLHLTQSLISHHLKDLKDIEMVTSEKRGLYVYYSLTPKGKKITNLLFKISQ